MEDDIDVLRRFVLKYRTEYTIASRAYHKFHKRAIRSLKEKGLLGFYCPDLCPSAISSEYSSRGLRITSLGLEKLIEYYPQYKLFFDNLNREMLHNDAYRLLEDM